MPPEHTAPRRVRAMVVCAPRDYLSDEQKASMIAFAEACLDERDDRWYRECVEVAWAR